MKLTDDIKHVTNRDLIFKYAEFVGVNAFICLFRTESEIIVSILFSRLC